MQKATPLHVGFSYIWAVKALYQNMKASFGGCSLYQTCFTQYCYLAQVLDGTPLEKPPQLRKVQSMGYQKTSKPPIIPRAKSLEISCRERCMTGSCDRLGEPKECTRGLRKSKTNSSFISTIGSSSVATCQDIIDNLSSLQLNQGSWPPTQYHFIVLDDCLAYSSFSDLY